jgi:hypothetical protein
MSRGRGRGRVGTRGTNLNCQMCRERGYTRLPFRACHGPFDKIQVISRGVLSGGRELRAFIKSVIVSPAARDFTGRGPSFLEEIDALTVDGAVAGDRKQGCTAEQALNTDFLPLQRSVQHPRFAILASSSTAERDRAL